MCGNSRSDTISYLSLSLLACWYPLFLELSCLSQSIGRRREGVHLYRCYGKATWLTSIQPNRRH